MKSKRSRLALVGVLALAISATVGLVSASIADAKKSKKNKAAVVSKTVNTAIPDRSTGGAALDGRLDVSLNVGKKFKGKVVGADGPSVTFQTTGDSATSAGDLTIYLVSPRGRLSQLNPDIGFFGVGQSIGPLTLTANSSIGLCTSASPPCPNPLATLNRPFAGTAQDSYLSIYHGQQVNGTWKLIFLDTANTKTSTVNSVKLSIPTA
jgi:hypothetical protein